MSTAAYTILNIILMIVRGILEPETAYVTEPKTEPEPEYKFEIDNRNAENYSVRKVYNDILNAAKEYKAAVKSKNEADIKREAAEFNAAFPIFKGFNDVYYYDVLHWIIIFDIPDTAPDGEDTVEYSISGSTFKKGEDVILQCKAKISDNSLKGKLKYRWEYTKLDNYSTGVMAETKNASIKKLPIGKYAIQCAVEYIDPTGVSRGEIYDVMSYKITIIK